MIAMPIHTSWMSMLRGMTKQYCTGKSKDTTSGKDVGGVRTCQKAESVFYATLRKHGWDEKQPRPQRLTEEVFSKLCDDTLGDMVKWYVEECNANKRVKK